MATLISEKTGCFKGVGCGNGNLGNLDKDKKIAKISEFFFQFFLSLNIWGDDNLCASSQAKHGRGSVKLIISPAKVPPPHIKISFRFWKILMAETFLKFILEVLVSNFGQNQKH